MADKIAPTPAQRRRRLVRGFDRAGIDALLVTALPNVRYLSGFTGQEEDDAYLLVHPRWAVLLTDSRFTEQVRRECPGLPADIRKDRYVDAVRRAIRGRKVRRLGVESQGIRLGFYQSLVEVLGAGRVRATKDLVEKPRQRKDPAELAAIRKAIRVGQRAFAELIAPGARRWLAGRSPRWPRSWNTA